MKLVCYSRNNGKKKVGVFLPEGRILDISRFTCENRPELASIQQLLDLGKQGMLQAAETVRLARKKDFSLESALALDAVTLHAPLGRPPKIICIGMNYLDHCRELGQEAPPSPVVFAKFGTAVQDPDKPIVRPRITAQLDYEAELGVVIGKGGRNISEESAMAHVAGYLNFNDVSARDLQFADGQWVRAKTCDTFAPMGPWLATSDEIPNPENLEVQCRVNGAIVQHSNTNQMVFSVRQIVSFLSSFMTLEVGDVIATGTPPGVGCFRKPPVYLQPGDVVEVEIQGLGILKNRVVQEGEPD